MHFDDLFIKFQNETVDEQIQLVYTELLKGLLNNKWILF